VRHDGQGSINGGVGGRGVEAAPKRGGKCAQQKLAERWPQRALIFGYERLELVE
jgi:hypothetical protein